MKIVKLTEDSVDLTINSTSNGFYSPGDTIIHLETAVETNNCSNCQFSMTYQIVLGRQPFAGTLDNKIWFDLLNNAYYTFIPNGYQGGAVQTVMAKM